MAVSSPARQLLQERCARWTLLHNIAGATFQQIPPAKVLVIGAGVAGLSAIVTASPTMQLRDVFLSFSHFRQGGSVLSFEASIPAPQLANKYNHLAPNSSKSTLRKKAGAAVGTRRSCLKSSLLQRWYFFPVFSSNS